MIAERRRDGRRRLSASDGFDVGRVAIGQGGLEGSSCTPLQMAEVAATVANGGRLMKPRLTDAIVAQGRAREGAHRAGPAVAGDEAESTAKELTEMMGGWSRRAPARAAALAGHRRGGQDRHGRGRARTASSPSPGSSLRARSTTRKVAVAVTVERTSGEGGTVAAPIAKQVLEALLGGGA